MATDNLSPHPTNGAQTSDESWLVMISRGRNDIYIYAMKSQNMLNKTLWSKGINLSGLGIYSPAVGYTNFSIRHVHLHFYTLINRMLW